MAFYDSPWETFTTWAYSFYQNAVRMFPTVFGMTLLACSGFVARMIGAYAGLKVSILTGLNNIIPAINNYMDDLITSASGDIFIYIYHASGVADGIQMIFLFIVAAFTVRFVGAIFSKVTATPMTFG